MVALARRVVSLVTPHQYADDTFDQDYGTDTGAPIPLLQIWRPRGHVDYGTTREGHIRVLLDPLPRESTVLDLGCGKGRVLCVAAMMGFRRVIGVEYNRRWIPTAQRNLAHLGVPGEVVQADARTVALPSGPLIVYLYNPFGPDIMRVVAANLRARVDPTWVVYVNPYQREAFADFDPQPLTERQAAKFSPSSVLIVRPHSATA